MSCPTGPRLKCISGLTLVTLVLDWFFWFSRGMWFGAWTTGSSCALRLLICCSMIGVFIKLDLGLDGGRLVLLLHYWHPGSRREG